MVRGMEAVVMCNSQRVAGRVYDALCLNARGPGALAAGINFPELVPDAVYAKLGLTRGQTDDAMGRYLAAFGGGEQAALSSPAAGAAGAVVGRAADGSAADASSAGSSSARSSSSGPAPPKAPERSIATVLDAAEIRTLQAGLRVARQRQWKALGGAGGGLLGVTLLSSGQFEASLEVPSATALAAAEGAAAAGTRSGSSAATAEAAGAAAVDSGAGSAPAPPAVQPAAAARVVVGVFPSEGEAARAREEVGYRAHRVAFAPFCNFPDEHASYLLRELPLLPRAPTAAAAAAATGSASAANDGSSSAAAGAGGSRSGRVRFETGSAAPASSAQPAASSASGSSGGVGSGASGGGGDSSRRRSVRAQAADTAADDAGADDDDIAAVWADASDARTQRAGAGTRSRGRADAEGASGAGSSNGAGGAASASSAASGSRTEGYAGSAGGAEERRVFRGLTYKASGALPGCLDVTLGGL
jgi:hypothetical protein